MKRKICNKDASFNLRGFTLPELLVVMVVSGLLLLSVMEGFIMFNGYGIRISRQLSRTDENYMGYYSLYSIVSSADSITDGRTAFSVFLAGNLTGRLHLESSSLIFRKGEFADTLLNGVMAFRVVKDQAGRYCDSVRIVLNHELRKGITVHFPVGRHTDEDKNYIVEKELRYSYD